MTTAKTELRRRRSLLWLIPERAARSLSWLVVAVCVILLVLIITHIRTNSLDRQQTQLTALLSERLCSQVDFHLTKVGVPGQYRLSDVLVGGDAGEAELRATSGTYVAPREGLAGQLDLEGGTWVLDLKNWTKPPGPRLLRLLQEARENDDLRCFTLSNFTVELRLGSSRLTLRGCIGRADLAPGGEIRGRIAEAAEGSRLTLSFLLADNLQSVTIAGGPLPWMREFLSPTVGGPLAACLTDTDGQFTVATRLGTAAGIRDNSKADLTAALDLSRLPEELGLGKMAGKLDVSLKVWGTLGRPGSFTAHATLAEGTTGTVSADALRNLHTLLTGKRMLLPSEDKEYAFNTFEISLLATPEHLFTTTQEGRSSGILAPGGPPLLTVSPGECLPIGELLRRLDELGRRWKEAHSS